MLSFHRRKPKEGHPSHETGDILFPGDSSEDGVLANKTANEIREMGGVGRILSPGLLISAVTVTLRLT